MPEHRRTLSNLLLVGQREAVAIITPGVSAELKRLNVRRTQQLTSRSLNARDEFILSRAFSQDITGIEARLRRHPPFPIQCPTRPPLHGRDFLVGAQLSAASSNPFLPQSQCRSKRKAAPK